MKKTIIISFVCLAVAMVAGYNVYQSNVKTKGLSDLALANVEALANFEWVNGKGWTCFKYLVDDVYNENFMVVKYCGDCSTHSATHVNDGSYCTYSGMYD